jgi:hypothetical protein
VLALAALVRLAGLSALVGLDAGSASELAWLGAAAAAVLLVVGMAGGAPGLVHLAVALLGAIFLLRQNTRLLVAPLYGAGLLLIEDLAVQAVDLRAVGWIAAEAIGARTTATLLVAAVGACGAAAAAAAVTVAPGRSVGLTALAAVVAVSAFAAIVRFARGRYSPSDLEESPPAAPPTF